MEHYVLRKSLRCSSRLRSSSGHLQRQAEKFHERLQSIKLEVRVFAKTNHTPSMPIGIWRTGDNSISLDISSRGRFVTFCPPDIELFRAAKEQGILRIGRCKGAYRPLLKEVVGLPGDVIEYSDGFLGAVLKMC